MKPLYWWLCLLWLIIVIPVLYYGIPYSEGEIIPTFDNVPDLMAWLVAVIFMAFPLIGLLFLRKARTPIE